MGGLSLRLLSCLLALSAGLKGDDRFFAASQAACHARIDLMVVLDESGSQIEVYDNHLGILYDLLGQVPIGDADTRVAMVRYSESAQLVFDFDGSVPQRRKEILDALKDLRPIGGPTATADAVQLAIDRMDHNDRPGATKVFLLLNDGHSGDTWDNVDTTARRLKATGAHVFVVTLSTQTDERELAQYAGDSRRIFNRTTLGNFIPTFSQFIRERCIPLTMEAPRPSLRVAPRVAPRVDEPPKPVRAQLKLRPQPVSRCVEGRNDIILLIDTSGSQEDVFREQQELAFELVSDLKGIGRDNFVAVIQFDHRASKLQSLDHRASKEQTMESLRNLHHTGGPTGTDLAIKEAIREMDQFRRPSARQIVILFNDGHSQAIWDDVMSTADELRESRAEVFVVALADDKGPELPFYSLRRPDRIFGADDKQQFIRARCNNGPPAPPFLFSRDSSSEEEKECEGKREVFLVLDSSGSVSEVVEAQKELAIRLVKVLDGRARFSVIDYSDEPFLRFVSRSDAQQVAKKIMLLSHLSGQTNTASAVELLVKELGQMRRGGKEQPLVVLMMDGNSQDSREVVAKAANRLHRERPDIFVAALSRHVDHQELLEYAGTDERIYGLGREDELVRAVMHKSCKTKKADVVRPRKEEVLVVPHLITAGPPLPAFLPQLDGNCTAEPTDLVIVLDSSSSMKGIFFTHRNVSSDLVASMPASIFRRGDVRVSLVSFSSSAKLVVSLGGQASRAELLNALGKVDYTGGETDLASGIRVAVADLRLHRRSKAKSLVLLFTDGHSRNRWSRVLEQSQDLHRTKATVYAVSYGTNTNHMELTVYTGSKGHIYDGPAAAARFMRDFRQRLDIDSHECIPLSHRTPRPAIPAPTTPVPTTTTTGKSAKATTLISPNLDPSCEKDLDLYIVVDTSSSIDEDFDGQLTFAGKIVKALWSMKKRSMRIGVISYSSKPILELRIDSGATRETVLDVIRGIDYIGDSTNTSGAVNLVLSEMRRAKLPNRSLMVVLLNDGQSQDSWNTVKDTSANLRAAASLVVAVSFSPSVYFPELIHYTGSEAYIYDRNGADQLIFDLHRFPVIQQPECEKSSEEEEATVQPIISPNLDSCDPSLDVFIIFDTSGSIKDSFERQKNLAVLFLDSLPADSRIGVSAVKFSSTASLEIPLQDKISRSDLRDFISKMEYAGGSSSLSKAVKLVIEQLNLRHDRTRKAVVGIFSDGKSEDTDSLVERTSRQLQRTGALVIAASFSPFVSEKELAHYTGSHDTVFLRTDAPKILDLVGNLRLCPSQLDTETTTQEPLTASCQVDLVFAIDTSSRPAGAFERHQERALSIIDRLPLVTGRVRASIITFGKDPNLVHGLRGYSSPELIKAKVNQMEAESDVGSIRDGVRLALGESLASRRPDSATVLLLLTNGASADSWNEVRALSRQLRKHNVHVFAVADEKDISRSELLQFTGEPSHLFVGPDGLGNLNKRLETVLDGPMCLSPIRLSGLPDIDFKRDCSKTQVDIVYIVDLSYNSKANFNAYKRVMEKHMSQLPNSEQISVGVVSVGDESHLEAAFSSDRERWMDNLEGVSVRGGQTSIAKAVKRATEMLSVRNLASTKVIAYIGSGRYSDSQASIEKALGDAKDVANAVLLLADYAEPVLVQLADSSSKIIRFYASDEDETLFTNTIGNIVEQSTCLTLQVPVTTTTVASTTTTATTTPTASLPTTTLESCDVKLDVMLVLDASGSVEEAFEAQKSLAKQLLEEMPLQSADVAVSIVQYSDEAELILPLSAGHGATELGGLLERLRWVGGRTETGAALGVALDDLRANGRAGAVPVLFLFHDGYSQDAWPNVKVQAKSLDLTPRLKKFILALPTNTYDPELLLYAGHPKYIYRKDDTDQLEVDVHNVFSENCFFKIDSPPVVVTKKDVVVSTTKLATTKTTPVPSTTTTTRPTTPTSTSSTIPPPTTEAPDCKSKLNVVFLIDSSGSSEEIFEKQRTIALDLLGMLPLMPESDHVRVGIVEFSSRHRVLVRLDDNRQTRHSAMAALGRIAFNGGNTATAFAVDEAAALIRNATDAHTHSIVIILNDGHSQDPWQRVRSTGNRLRSVADDVFVVALAEDVYLPELRLYAGEERNVFLTARVPSFVRSMREILADVAECAAPLAASKFHSDARDVSALLTFPLRANETDRNATGQCGPTDVLFLMDTSGSMGEWGLEKEKAIILGAVDRLDVSLDSTRIALGQFAGELKSRLVFPFDAFGSKAGLRSGIRAVELGVGGVTRLDRALDMARSAFVNRTGAREGARRLVVLLSDGYSQTSPSESARVLRDSGVAVVAIGVRRSADARLNPSGLLAVAGHHRRVFLAHHETLAAYQALADATRTCSA